jgi:hypothetical protein
LDALYGAASDFIWCDAMPELHKHFGVSGQYSALKAKLDARFAAALSRASTKSTKRRKA